MDLLVLNAKRRSQLLTKMKYRSQKSLNPPDFKLQRYKTKKTQLLILRNKMMFLEIKNTTRMIEFWMMNREFY